MSRISFKGVSSRCSCNVSPHRVNLVQKLAPRTILPHTASFSAQAQKFRLPEFSNKGLQPRQRCIANIVNWSARSRVPASSYFLSSASSEASSGGDIIPFNLADIGEGIAEVEILQWFIQEGDHVKAFDRICEVQSDKATVEISCRYDGQIVKVHHEVGGMAKVGQPLIDIRREGAVPTSGSESSAMPPPSQPAANVEAESSTPAPSPPQNRGASKPLATPAVRGIIKGRGLDINDIPASGRDGRVTKQDVQKYLAEKQKFDSLTIEPPAGVQDQTPSQPIAQQTDPPPASHSASMPAPLREDQVVKVRGFMRTMIKTMQAQTAIPHFGYSDEYDMEGVLQLRHTLQAEAKEAKLTYMPIIIKALSLSLTDFPEINAKFSKDMESVTYFADHNIGIAVDTPTGLVVPNIKAVQNLSIFEIAKELENLAMLARENRLTPQQLSGGTITLSNIGAIGGTYTSPILMPGEAAIGAIGSIEKIPRYDSSGQLVPVRVMRVSWSGDHRLLAGATLARFSNRFKGLLQDPARMLLSLR